MRLLAFWAYHRPGMREFLHDLPPEVSIHFVFFRRADEDPTAGQLSGLGISYWGDYRDAADVLDRLRPDKVLFLGIDSLYTIALNHTCRTRGVPTLFLQHGLFFGNEEELALQSGETLGALGWDRIKAWLKSVAFYFRGQWGAGRDYWTFPFRFIVDRLRKGAVSGLIKHRDGFRQADTYIVFTVYGAEPWLKGRHGVGPEKMVQIGNPTFDDFFQETAATNDLPPYYLLVDQPVTATGLNLRSAQQHQDFYGRLAQFARERGCHLVIKLHPDDYSNPLACSDDNVIFLRQVDSQPALIQRALGVFGFFSTLLIPAIALRPCCLFRLQGDNALLRDVAELGLGAVMGYDDDPAAVPWDTAEKPAQGLAEFERRYLYRADGAARQRLHALLLA